MSNISNSIRTGLFLGVRTFIRSSKNITALIVVILTLIFLNLIGIGGLLVGLISSSDLDYRTQFSGDILTKPLVDKTYTQLSSEFINYAKTLPGFAGYSPRINASATLSLNWKDKAADKKGNQTTSTIVGIDPILESKTTTIHERLLEGRWLLPNDQNAIVIGNGTAGRDSGFAITEKLTGVRVGSKLLVKFSNGFSKEFEIVGIYKSKAGLRNNQALIPLKELKQILNISDDQYSEIAIKVDPKLATPESFKELLWQTGMQEYNRIETWNENRGSAANNINIAFTFIGNVVGGIGLLVGGITIFILIFVNASSKRKFIGVLKASGISSRAIVFSYIFIALCYCAISILIGLGVFYFMLVPALNANPIDFPFADVRITVGPDYVFVRAMILAIVSFLGGLIPSYLISKENTLDAILGR